MYFLEADPGERLTETLIIKNSTGVSPTFTFEAFDMQAANRDGTTAFEFPPAGDAPRGAGEWIAPIAPTKVKIAPYEQAELQLVIDVPADAGAGGHFGALMVTAPDPRRGSQVRFEVRQPIPIFVTVRGAFEHDVRVSATATDRWRWTGGAATWDVRISNDGDVHEPVSGRVRLDGMLGGRRSVLLEPGILFPGESRTQRVSFELRDAPDLLTATARVDLDDAPTEQDDAPRVVLLPWWILALVVLAIVVIVLRIRLRGRGSGASDPYEPADDEWITPAG